MRTLREAVLMSLALAVAGGPAVLAQAPSGAARPAAAAGAARDLDRFVGAYEITRFVSMIVTRQGEDLILQQQQGPPAERFTLGGDGLWVGAQTGRRADFDLGPDGRVLALAFADGPTPGVMPRLADGETARRAAELAARVKAQVPDARTEGVIRDLIGGLREGNVRFDRFGERMAVAARAQFPGLRGEYQALGALQSLAFKGVGPGGGDIYDAVFANGRRQFRVLLDAQGRIDAMGIQMG